MCIRDSERTLFRDFQRISISVRVATSTFADHSAQVVSDKLTMDFVRERDRSRAIGYFLCLSLTKSRKFLFETMDTLRATFQIPLKVSKSLSIKKPIQ